MVKQYLLAALLCYSSNMVFASEACPDPNTGIQDVNVSYINGQGEGRIVTLIPHDLHTVWQILIDFEKYVTRIKEIEKFELYEGDFNNNAFKVKVALEGPTRIYQYHLYHQINVINRSINWTLDRSLENDFTSLTGSWALTPVGRNKTCAIFTTSLELNHWLPSFAMKLIAKNSLHAAIEWVDQVLAEESNTQRNAYTAKH